MNESIMRQAGFDKEVDAVKCGKCPICNQEIDMEEFVDEISRREFYISGMCQKCQNEIFGNDEDEEIDDEEIDDDDYIEDWDNDLFDEGDNDD